jgi:hypothetical protein
MRELMGLANVYVWWVLDGTEGLRVCLTLIKRVPIFTVAMGGVVGFRS